MSRSGYVDDVGSEWALICWRGVVASSIKGRRGQAFLREMQVALDAMESKRLIADELRTDRGEVCAIGAVGAARGVDMDGLDPHDREGIAVTFGIAPALAAEIAYMNDEYAYHAETPEARFARIRAWVTEHLKDTA